MAFSIDGIVFSIVGIVQSYKGLVFSIMGRLHAISTLHNVGEASSPVDYPQNKSLKINDLKAPAGRGCL